MTERYFEKFPLTTYSNNTVVDITKRTTLLNVVYNDPYSFYPYEITSNERADQLSHRYYEDPYQSWIVYFSNKIVDPYHEWYMSDKELLDLIINKYGSYDLAVNKVKHYRNDWINKENVTKSYYDALPPNNKKYWEPEYGFNNRIISYKRAEKDWITNTNKIISYEVTGTSDSYLLENELCTIHYGNKTGKAQFLSATTTYVYLQHVSGTYLSSGSGYITGQENGANISFTSASLVASNISEEEESYWKPVTFFDYENERNEYNKTVRVIDKSYKQKISDNLKTLMSE